MYIVWEINAVLYGAKEMFTMQEDYIGIAPLYFSSFYSIQI
jgi:hypothetical protein